jgi:cytochrome c553
MAASQRPVPAERLARFEEVQVRDGFPDMETGVAGHCRACHEVDGDPYGPRCGHYAGCPEC